MAGAAVDEDGLLDRRERRQQTPEIFGREVNAAVIVSFLRTYININWLREMLRVKPRLVSH